MRTRIPENRCGRGSVFSRLFRPLSEFGLLFVKFAPDLLGRGFAEEGDVLRRVLAYTLAESAAESVHPSFRVGNPAGMIWQMQI